MVMSQDDKMSPLSYGNFLTIILGEDFSPYEAVSKYGSIYFLDVVGGYCT